MKNSILLSVFVSMAFIGCQNESITTETLVQSNYTVPNPEKLYNLDALDPDQPFEMIDMSDIVDLGDQITRNPNQHAQGHFTGGTPTGPDDDRFYKSATINFNALLNSQGTNGNASFVITWGENGEYTWHFNADAELLSVLDNEAVYCGIVTIESGERPTNLEGAKIWFRVIDEGGQGNNSNTDRYYDGLLFSFSPRVICESFSIGSSIWESMDQREVEFESDMIKVD